MTEEAALELLVRSMKPVLQPGAYVLCSLSEPVELNAMELIGSFQEPEGLSAIVSQQGADRLGLTYSSVAAWIMVQADSSLPVQFLPVLVGWVMNDKRISHRVIPALHHVHLFVALADVAQAVASLEKAALDG